MDVRSLTSPNLTGIPGAALRPASPAPLAPADGFQASPSRLTLMDKANLATAVSVTGVGLAALAGAGDVTLGVLGIPALVAAPVITAGLLLGRDQVGIFQGMPRTATRVAAAAVTAAGVAALAGAGATATALLALPALVAAPVALGAVALNAWRGR